MPKQLNPLEATQRIQEDYRRYLRTIYFFHDSEIRRQFWDALEQPNFLLRGPILEAAPPFRQGKSIEELVNDGILHPEFQQLCSDALPYRRPLYLHQHQAIEKVVKHRRNVVVSTGTGSGKTETFLLPIFDHLLRQRTTDTLQQPGVRALLLYPMNALANDQLKRLRKLLAKFPDITFGRYTGETSERQSDAEKLFREQFPDDGLPLNNERLSRERMRADPPHILITNFAMLEYLLLRPKDSEFFDGDTGQFWRFIVLDEAHIYDGASGIELAMLIRRLKDRVVKSERGRITGIATSATLGKGREDFPAVVNFAQELFGESFAWKDDLPEEQDVVEGTREQDALLQPAWGAGSNTMYADLINAINHDESLAKLSALTLGYGVASDVIRQAQQAAGVAREQSDQYNRFLFDLLRGDENLHRLRSILSTPQPLFSVASEMAGVDGDPQTIIDLVNLAVRARPDIDSISLLPARYHVFVRSLEGAFICLNHTQPIHAHESKPRIFLTRHENCPHCQSQVFEMATCPRCGTAYLVGREVTPTGKSHKVLRHPSSMSDDLTSDLSYFVLPEEHIHEPDEDEAMLNGQSLEQIENEATDVVTLCLGCGAVGNENNPARCGCISHIQRIQLRRVVVQDPPLRRCVSCGVRNTTGIVYRFLTGRDAPVSVLATSLYQLLPPSDDEKMADLSGEGRKLMIFADSRQDAAFFAPYLERTYRQMLRRRLILKSLTQDSVGHFGHLRLQDVAERVRRESEANNLFTIEQSQDKRTRLALLWLMQEFVALDVRIGLEGLGLLHFRLVPPLNWEPPTPLLADPWNLTPEEAWALTIALLDSVRRQGAVSFPENVDPKSTDFEPRNVRIFVSDYADGKQNVIGWLPKRGGNRRMGYLVRILRIRQPSMEINKAIEAARELLIGLWKHLTAPRSPWRTHFQAEKLKMGGIAYQVNHTLWEWVPTHEATIPVYYCNSCFNITYTNIDHVCPQYGCDGVLRPANEQSEVWRSNHYRNLYQNLNPIGLSVEEHTAQWTPKDASDIQSKFISGQINVLSCSTTFELGVDVGELQTVLMRNMPPTTANYVQRAGRAGRRTDSVAFVLTFAQRRSHDLTYFKHPERMVAGRVNPPVVVVQNEKIVRRHVHSVFIAAFLRWALDEHQRKFEKAGDFFAVTNDKTPGTELFRQYVAMYPSTVGDALYRIVPDLLREEIGIQDWSWLSALTAMDGKGILDRATQEIHNDLNTYAQLEQEAVRERRYKQAEHFQRVAITVQSRDLLGFLGARNVLPKYGFPVDVVELRTEHIPVPEANRVELDRDLRMAISEYAPGSEVVAAKRIWIGDGLYKMPGRDWQTMNYAVCPGCGRFHRSLQPIESVCNVCGTSVFGWPKRYGEYVIPEFGFVASRETREPGERRPKRTFASQVYFFDYESGDNHKIPELELISAMSGEAIEVYTRYSRFGKLAVVNSGFSNAGFRICQSCGWAEPAQPVAPGRRPTRQSEHKNPRTGNPCHSGQIINRHLGHEFITDVLELRFSGYLAPRDNEELWISVLYAILEGASETLGIARDDLNGTLYPYNSMNPPALILFDNVPGGAGHVKRLNNSQALKAILRSSLERVTDCECGEETSCYECLRNFYNQYYHDKLRRGLVRDFLRQVLEQTEN